MRNVLFCLAVVGLLSSCSAILSRVDGSHSEPIQTVKVNPQTGRPFIASNGGWQNAKLRSISPAEYALIMNASGERAIDTSVAYANIQYANLIEGYNSNMVNAMSGGTNVEQQIADLGAKVDAVGANNLASDCVAGGGSPEECMNGSASAAPPSAPTPPVTPTVVAPQAPPPVAAPTPAVQVAPVSNAERFKSLVEKAGDKNALADALTWAASVGSTGEAKQLLGDQAKQIRGSDTNYPELKRMLTENLTTYVAYIQ